LDLAKKYKTNLLTQQIIINFCADFFRYTSALIKQMMNDEENELLIRGIPEAVTGLS
jgi:hypothetical protein